MGDAMRRPEAEPAPPCTLVIFGANGDLTKRLLMPALYNLSCGDLLDEHFTESETILQLETATVWGRYSGLFDHDSAGKKFFIPETTEDIDGAADLSA